jgi:hypothetical protein
MNPAKLSREELAQGFERLARELRADPAASPYELRLEAVPGVPVETPNAATYRQRVRRRNRDSEPDPTVTTNRDRPPNVTVAVTVAEATPAAVRPAPLEPSIPARGVRISGSVSGSDPEIAKETAVVAKGSDRSTREAEATATAMTADWIPPDTLLAQLEMMPGIPRAVTVRILGPAALHFAQDESIRKTPAQWRQIMSRWACKAWQDPKARAAATAAASELPQVGGFHEGPVQRIDAPAEWTRQVKAPPSPPPPETIALLERLREQRRAQDVAAVLEVDRPAPGNVDAGQGKIGGDRG